MTNSIPAQGRSFQLPFWPIARHITRAQKQRETLANLQATLARKEALLREKCDLLQRQDLLALEFEHRLTNSLQLVVSLLSLQGRDATPEVAAQLGTAARRVAAFGRVHRHLNRIDHQERIEFKQYLQHLCADLSNLLLPGGAGSALTVAGAKLEIPTAFAIPLGFIATEMITNSVKYAEGNIIVRLETTSAGHHSLSVLDNGPGLPAGFDPASCKGLGTKIMLSLAKQIGGTLQIAPADGAHGARFAVTFRTPGSRQMAPDGIA